MAFKFLGYEISKKAASQPVHQQADFLGLGSALPTWITFTEDIDFLNCWISNPVLRAVLEIKARAKANMKLNIKDLKTGEYLQPGANLRPDAASLIKLLRKPNPLQTQAEWMFHREVNYGVFGNSYDYGTLPTGFNQFNYENVSSIKQLPPYLTSYALTGKYFDQTTIEGIISSYYVRLAGMQRPFPVNQILHRSDTNIRFDNGFAKGVSKLIGLRKPLSNIEMAFESRNVIIKKRGALGIFTSDKKDANGIMPLLPKEIKDVQDTFANYGTLDDQYQYIISPIPIRYQKTTLTIKELQLFEEVASDAMLICNAFGVPEVLLKLYLEGATFENQEASESRLYQGTVIPESDNDITALNSWLKTEENGLVIEGSFDHIPVLQKSEKDKAATYNIISQYQERLFMHGAITLAQWLISMDIPVTDKDDIRVWDLSPAQLDVILARHKTTNTNNNENS